MKVNCFAEKEESCRALAEYIVTVAGEAIGYKDNFSMVLSGGSTPTLLYKMLAESRYGGRVAWEKIHLFFGDERCVPPEHALSNFGMVKKAMLEKLAIPGAQVHRMKGELRPLMAAEDYNQRLETLLPAISDGAGFDMVLLGLGTDGHTASLFPGDGAMHSGKLVIPVEAPEHVRPAVARISLTLKGIQHAGRVVFLVHGQDKETIAKRVFLHRELDLPAANISNHNLDLYISGMDCSLFTDG